MNVNLKLRETQRILRKTIRVKKIENCGNISGLEFQLGIFVILHRSGKKLGKFILENKFIERTNSDGRLVNKTIFQCCKVLFDG